MRHAGVIFNKAILAVDTAIFWIGFVPDNPSKLEYFDVGMNMRQEDCPAMALRNLEL
jgi:hypothetical protein